MNKTVKRLTTSAMLVALSSILSLLTLYELPYGGSITVCSMLPVCVLAYKYGLKWGMLGGFTLGVVNMLTGRMGGGAFATMKLFDFLLMLFLDYILAYTCIGLVAITRKKFKNEHIGFSLGIVIACTARLLVHALSGYILFNEWAEWFFSQDGFTFGAWVLDHMSGQGLIIFYSFFYNATFLVPETIITVIAGAVVIGILRRYILEEEV